MEPVLHPGPQTTHPHPLLVRTIPLTSTNNSYTVKWMGVISRITRTGKVGQTVHPHPWSR